MDPSRPGQAPSGRGRVSRSLLSALCPDGPRPAGSSVPKFSRPRTLEWGCRRPSPGPREASPRAGQDAGEVGAAAPCTRRGGLSSRARGGEDKRAGAATVVTLGPLSQNAPKTPSPPQPLANAQMHPGAGDRVRVGGLPGSPSASADALGHPAGRCSGGPSPSSLPLAGHSGGRTLAEEEQKPPGEAPQGAVPLASPRGTAVLSRFLCLTSQGWGQAGRGGGQWGRRVGPGTEWGHRCSTPGHGQPSRDADISGTNHIPPWATTPKDRFLNVLDEILGNSPQQRPLFLGCFCMLPGLSGHLKSRPLPRSRGTQPSCSRPPLPPALGLRTEGPVGSPTARPPAPYSLR